MSSLKGPMLMVAAMAGFAIEDAVIKDLSTRMPPGQVAITLGAGGALAFGIALWRKRERFFSPAALRGAVLLRNVSEMGAAMFMILALALVPMSLVAAIMQAMPLMVTLGAALFLGEPVGWRRWSAILVGFVGVLILLRPGSTGFDIYAILPLISVMFLTARDIATRRVPGTVSSLQVSGWGFFSVIPGGLLLLAMRGEAPVVPSAMDGVLMVITIVVAMTAYMMLVASTRLGDLAATTPFRYSRLVFAMVIGILWFGERPDLWTLVGSAVIVAAGLYTLLREIKINRRPVPTPETATLP